MHATSEIRYGDWTPQVETVTELVDLTQARKLAATFDLDEAVVADGGTLPPMWHWLYFQHRAPTSRIGTDGHPERGGFFPPVELQRRMFASERAVFHAPLTIGRPATRTGTISGVEEKTGRAGRMVLASASYRIEQDGALCIEDTHDIIYIAGGATTPAPGDDAFAPPPDAWHQRVKTDPVLLFRFSALTFNGHRIHYDPDYAQNEEGYPGRVVHGPLTALLLAEFARRHVDAPMSRYAFRGRAPLFEPWPFHLVGRPADDGTLALEAVRNDGVIAMTATAAFAGGGQ